MPSSSSSSNDSFLSQLSFTTIRVIIITLCLLSLAGPILLIIGIGILKTPDNYDTRAQTYNDRVDSFNEHAASILTNSEGRLVQFSSTNSSSIVAVELLFPSPTNKPFSQGPELPHGNVLLDTSSSARSIPLESNASSTSIDRSLWSFVYDDNQNGNGLKHATVLNITTTLPPVPNSTETNEKLIVSQVPLPPLLDPETVVVPSTFCQPPAGEKICTPSRMQQLCQRESKCQNAKYNGSSCPAGKGCKGCYWTRYQTTVCIPVALSDDHQKFVPSMKMKSCLYPFTSIEDEMRSSGHAGYISYGDKNENINRRLRQITSCRLNVSTSDDNNNNNNNNKHLPLQIVLMVDTDPFFVAQNMTKGTNVFPGLPLQAEREVGLSFTIGGAALIIVIGLAWMSLQILMKKDERTARHVYRAFGQLYIPSTSDYVHAISQGMGYKHSNGFLPSNTNGNSRASSASSAGYQPPVVAREERQHKKFSAPLVFLNGGEVDENRSNSTSSSN